MKMRVNCFLVLLLLANLTFAQIPQAFKYQAVARNSAGMLLNNASLTVRVGVRDISVTGSIVYQETHAVTTNSFGLINLNIGRGSVTSGTFASINWGIGDKFVEIEIDYGTGYVSMGISQLLSVPYALYAANGPVGPAGPVGPQGIQGPIGPQGVPGTLFLPNWQSINSNAIISQTTDVVIMPLNSTTYSLTLPAANTVPKGKIIVFKRNVNIGGPLIGNYVLIASGTDVIETLQGLKVNLLIDCNSGAPGGKSIFLCDGASTWYWISD